MYNIIIVDRESTISFLGAGKSGVPSFKAVIVDYQNSVAIKQSVSQYLRKLI